MNYMTAYYYTFGCKVNQYETDVICELMEKSGFSTVSEIKLAEVIIINSCTVTGWADNKLRQLIRRIRRENPEAMIALCGCFPQTYPESSVLLEADVVLGENNKTSVPDIIKEYLEDRIRKCCILPHSKNEKIEPMSLAKGSGKTRAAIRIQDGCDRFCSYCIIPYARGRSRSKPLDEIAKEAARLAESGHKEIIIVGINLSCYGLDFNDGTNIADAVHAVCSRDGVLRVRLGSIEPEMLTDSIITRLSKEAKLCPQFHLSLQSGCDKTLKEMRRKYDTREYLALVESLRRHFPGCAITTDVMTGFAGETEEDFKQSVEFVKKVGFSKVHVFPYSEREGTVAAKRSDHLPLEIRYKRAEIMAEAASVSERLFLESLIGRMETVLFEREHDNEWHQGHTGSYVLVKVRHFTDTLWKEIKKVRIISVEDGFCIGEILPE